jgi:hydroxyacylglutathione hydrolase
MPDYYLRMKVLNAAGAPSLEGLPGAKPLACEKVQALSEEGATLVDLRGPEAFAGAHIAGAINIGAGQSLSLWAGWLLDPAKRIVLVADYADAEAAGDDAVGANAVGANAAGANAAGANEAARRALVRVGLDRIAGSVAMPAWIAEGREFRTTRLWSVAEVERERGGLYVLDVRSEQEWAPGTIPGTMLGSIPGAHHIMLGDLPRRIAEVPREAQVVTVCGSGYRSIIAASLLERAGDRNVGTMAGGMMAWRRRGLAVAV